ncbi:MAG: metallophosphoesterase [Bacteroidales bacterium]|nr:metallophosphoesterase [Bacteroidales bacterium]
MNKFLSFSVIFYLVSALFLTSCEDVKEAEAKKSEVALLAFGPQKTFKIAQFTDIHWKNENAEECENTIKMIRFVLETEKPDLVALTGDIVNDPAEAGWKAVMSVFTEAGIPFAVTLGNHDDESDWSRDQIFDYLETLPGFIGQKGPTDITGVGNYVVELKSDSNSKTSALLYFFDSNAYCNNKKISDYDWIKFDQIEWYRHQSSQYTAANEGKPLPALAFFHIPLLEYKEISGKENTLGQEFEGVYSPQINSGLFGSFVDMRDVIGTFVGHDHDNNYIGIHKEIALAFGQNSGYSGYGIFAKGSRIIELKEGEFGFDTWIRTQDSAYFYYNYPFGLHREVDENEYLPSQNTDLVHDGLLYNYFEGKFKSVNDFPFENPVKSGKTQNFDLGLTDAKDFFGIEFHGLIKIPEKGLYKFYTFSDDGSQLFIGGKLVVDNDGSHSATRKEGSVALEAGFHDLRLMFFDDYMGETLEVGFSSIKSREATIPDAMLFHK